MWVGTCVVLKDSLEESLLSFHHMGSWDLTHIIKLGGEHLYPRSHLISSALVFVFIYLFTYYLFSVLVCVCTPHFVCGQRSVCKSRFPLIWWISGVELRLSSLVMAGAFTLGAPIVCLLLLLAQSVFETRSLCVARSGPKLTLPP